MGDFIDENEITGFSLKTWKKLGPFLRPLKNKIAFVLVMMILSAAVDAAIPLFTRYAVDNFVVSEKTDGIGSFTLIYIGVILFQALTTIFYSRQSMIIEMFMAREMKNRCFDHLQKLPISFYNQTSVGYILARVMSDTEKISGMVAWMGTMMFWYIFYLAGILISMFLINAKLALIVIAIVPALVITGKFFMPRILGANREMRRANSKITSSFNENINGAKVSKTLVIEDKNASEFAGISADMYESSLRAIRLDALFLPIITFFGSFAVALVLYYSGNLVLRQAMDFGILSAFIAYAIAILDPISHMASFFSEVMAAQVNIERVMALVTQPVDIEDSWEVVDRFGDIFDPKAENWPLIKGDIEFRDVWFRYPDAAEDDYVLKDVSLCIKAGTTVALVGETGAGKSTMVNLACRFFEPTKGQVLIDGVDYRERGLLWLHRNLGYVQQSPHLFSGTILDNIRYGKLDATDDEIKRAAELVSADTVAKRLRDGYNSDVGEGGGKLSTGEKQLISFARAIIGNPPIFVLDEATSSIDTETEHLIQNAISHVLKGRTSFIIAHRLSTIRNADLILLVDGQGIDEMGSHEELMKKKGKYFKLYTTMMIKDESRQEGFGIIF